MENSNSNGKTKPEIETYKHVLEKALKEGKGKITDTKAQVIMKIRASLGITENEHNEIMSELMGDYEARNLATYRSAIEQALLDERVTSDEEAILELLRISMNISFEEHTKIIEEIKENIQSEKIIRSHQEQDSDFQQMLSDENDPYYWVRKGELIWLSAGSDINQALQALAYFDKALELDSDNYLAWANKGLILKNLDRVEDALLCYNRALRINPDYITVWYNKGVLLGSIGNFPEAIKAFEKVLELNPEHEFAKRDRSILMSILSDEDNTE